MLRKRMGSDKGFTLIELMVVVLIIAILIAIAIPTFLGLRARSQDRDAQSNLRNALTAAKAYFTDSDSYTGFTGVVGETVEPSLEWNDGATAEGEVSVHADANTVTLTTRSASGATAFFCLADSKTAGTKRGNVDAGSYAGCTGTW